MRHSLKVVMLMTDEERKLRYRKIVKKLRRANNKMDGLVSSLDSLSSSLSRNINVDGKGYDSSTVTNLSDRADSLQDKNIGIINSLVRKINQLD